MTNPCNECLVTAMCKLKNGNIVKQEFEHKIEKIQQDIFVDDNGDEEPFYTRGDAIHFMEHVENIDVYDKCELLENYKMYKMKKVLKELKL